MFLLIRLPAHPSNRGWCHFTFHYVSINTALDSGIFSAVYSSLHSTMFLLIQPSLSTCPQVSVFTFHYVSINTAFINEMDNAYHPLHSTMFLLIPLWFSWYAVTCIPLHSTMFLLILELGTFIVSNISDFTFHYVSINTLYRFFSFRFLTSLHSTMFLLIR